MIQSKAIEQSINPFIEDEKFEWEQVGPGVRRKIMTYDDRIMMVKVAFEKGGIGTLHTHYHTQLSYLDGGVFEIEVAGKKHILKDGDVFHIEPNLLHGVVCLEAGVLIDVFSPMREDFIK